MCSAHMPTEFLDKLGRDVEETNALVFDGSPAHLSNLMPSYAVVHGAGWCAAVVSHRLQLSI